MPVSIRWCRWNKTTIMIDNLLIGRFYFLYRNKTGLLAWLWSEKLYFIYFHTLYEIMICMYITSTEINVSVKRWEDSLTDVLTLWGKYPLMGIPVPKVLKVKTSHRALKFNKINIKVFVLQKNTWIIKFNIIKNMNSLCKCSENYFSTSQ